MRPNPALIRFLENECERVIKLLVRAQPCEFAGSHLNVRLENLLELAPRGRVETIGSDDQIIILGKLTHAVDVMLELELHTKITRTRLQVQQQLLAPDPAETMPCG